MKDFLKNLKLNESNVSMLLGIVVVLIVGGLLVNYFKSVNNGGQVTSTSTNLPSSQIQTSITPNVPTVTDLPSDYTIQKGDSLWKIAESVYSSGYNWTDIYEANKTVLGSNPNVLEAGTKIRIPKAEMKQATAVPQAPVSYTVIKGDTLWNIALTICHNGYLWPQIAQNNNLSNPNLIEPGVKLQVSCR